MTFNKNFNVNAALKPIQRRCVVCAWAGEVHRGILRCPDCNTAFKPIPGPYRVVAGKEIPAGGEFIDAIEFNDGSTLIIINA